MKPFINSSVYFTLLYFSSRTIAINVMLQRLQTMYL